MFNLFAYTEAKLARDIIRICKLLLPHEQFSYDSENHAVTCKQADIYLCNIFEQVKDRPQKARIEFISHFLHSVLDQQAVSYETSSHLLIPRINSKAEINRLQEYLSVNTPTQIPHLKLTENFICILGLNRETSIHSVTGIDLNQMGLSFDEALKHAQANLYQLEESPFVEIEPGLFSVDMNDDHNASRIMLTDKVASLPVNGSPVALLPTANEIFICGSEDTELLGYLAPKCLALNMQKTPLCLHPIVLKNGQWQEFFPPRTDDYAPIHNLHQIECSIQYSAQKIDLDEKFSESNIDIFVAAQSLFEREDTLFFFSVCTWTESTHSYLPQADQVHFVANISGNELGVLGVLSWQDTMEHFGDLMKPIDTSPKRYEVINFPNKNKLLSLIAKQ